MAARIIELAQDYAFRPVLPVFSGIPEQFHAGLSGGTLALVQCRLPAPGSWYVAPAESCFGPAAARPGSAALYRLADPVDASLFALQADAPGWPDWGRYLLDLARLARHRRRLAAAERAACWFNRQAGAERRRVDNLSDVAVLVLALARTSSACLWMYRSLAAPVLELVRAGHGAVLPEGRFVPNASAVADACRIKTRRHICLQWVRPPAIETQLAAGRGRPPVLGYPIE